MSPDHAALFTKHVGSRIKFYRKMKHLSLDALASEVHKSKSTLSKYENGLIPIDIASLYEISQVLNVDVSQLTDFTPPSSGANTVALKNPFGGKENLYIYYYDGRTQRIVKTLLVLKNGGSGDNNIPCQCYMDTPSFQDYNNCKYFYIGTMTYFDLVTYVTLNNLSNPMEQIGLCLLNPFHHNQDTWGFMFGISYNPITPFALKFLMSTSPIPPAELRQEDLVLTKSELKMLKNLNMMLLNTQEP